MAMTRRWPTTWVRVHSHAAKTESTTAASRRLKVRRIADSDGTRRPVDPNAARRFSSASAAHCPIAANDRAPAATAAIPTAKIPGSRCRIPRARRGSGTDSNNVSNADAEAGPKGCEEAGAVREDDIGGCGPEAGWGLDNRHPSPADHTRHTHHSAVAPQTCRSRAHQPDFAEALVAQQAPQPSVANSGPDQIPRTRYPRPVGRQAALLSVLVAGWLVQAAGTADHPGHRPIDQGPPGIPPNATAHCRRRPTGAEATMVVPAGSAAPLS